jgi:hypothetical protein
MLCPMSGAAWADAELFCGKKYFLGKDTHTSLYMMHNNVLR